MYKAVKGTYENGQIILEEPAPTLEKSKVVVMFIPEEEEKNASARTGGVRMGSLAGRGYSIPDDFNEMTIEGMEDYM